MTDPLDLFGALALPDPLDVFGGALVDDEEERRRRKRLQLAAARRRGDQQAARMGLDDVETDLGGAFAEKVGTGVVAGLTGLGRFIGDAFDPLRATRDPLAHETLAAISGQDAATIAARAPKSPILHDADERAQRRDAEARQRVIEAASDLPTPLAYGATWGAEAAGLALDPLNLFGAGIGAKVGRGAVTAARGVRLVDDLAEAGMRGFGEGLGDAVRQEGAGLGRAIRQGQIEQGAARAAAGRQESHARLLARLDDRIEQQRARVAAAEEAAQAAWERRTRGNAPFSDASTPGQGRDFQATLRVRARELRESLPPEPKVPFSERPMPDRVKSRVDRAVFRWEQERDTLDSLIARRGDLADAGPLVEPPVAVGPGLRDRRDLTAPERLASTYRKTRRIKPELRDPSEPLNMAAARVQGERLGAAVADLPPNGSLPPLPELADAPRGLHRLVDWGRSRMESFGQFGPASRRFVDPEIRQYIRHTLPREIEMAVAEAETWERQAQRLRHGFEDAVRQVAKETGENPAVLRRQANAARLANDTTSLPEPIRAAVDGAGEWVDGMSRRMIETGAARSKVETFQANMGRYLHRSYGSRDAADFADLMRGRPEFDEAQRFLAGLYPDKSPDEILGIMNQLMDPADGRFPLAFGRRGGALPKQDLRELRRRKEIAEPLRRLMGEREDFAVNLQRTAALQAHDLAFHKLAQRVAEEGRRMGIFQETPRGGLYRQLPKSDRWGDLEGLHTLPEVEQLLGGFEQHSRSATVAYINGMAKAGKTLGSHVAQIRNWMSGFGASLANGRFLPSPAWRNMGRNFVEADRVATSTVFGHSDTALARFKVSGLDELAADIDELTRYRVLAPGARAGEVLDYATEVAHHLETPGPRGVPRGRLRRGAAQAVRKTGGFFSRTYRAGDDFWKVFNWRAEVDELAWANEAYPLNHPRRRTLEAIKAEAAELVNEQLQTYSRTAPVGKSLARNPLFGAFATFQLEAPRNLKNIFKRGLAEIVEARETGNMRMAVLGSKRLTGAAATLAMPPAIATWALAEHGFDAERQEAFRSFIPPYLSNSRIVPVARIGNKVIFVATQDQDYFNGPQRLYLAFARPGSPLERFERLAMEGVNLYLGEQPGVVPAIEALANRRMGGALDIVEPGVGARNEVYRDTATLPAKVGAAAAHVGRGMAPGVVTTGERVLRSLGVMENPRGLDPAAEVTTAMTGIRHQTVDIADSFGFKARAWARERSEIAADFNRTVREKGAATNPKLQLQLQREREAEWKPRYQAIQQYVDDARLLGLSRREVDGLLKDAEISESMRDALLAGRYISFVQYKRSQRSR